MNYRGYMFNDGAGLWWILGLVCMIVLVVGVVWLLVTLTRGGRSSTPQQPWQPPYPGPGMVPPAPPRPTPHDILRERLARGDISVEDYQRTMSALGPDPYAPPPPTA